METGNGKLTGRSVYMYIITVINDCILRLQVPAPTVSAIPGVLGAEYGTQAGECRVNAAVCCEQVAAK
jgi:xanthosine utilization system XapX-like protein